MNGVRYEHHYLSMFINGICPFKIKKLCGTADITANWHRNPEIIYVTEGNGTLQCGKESIQIKKGGVYMIPSQTIHRIFGEKGMDYNFIIIDEKFCIENGLKTDNRIFETDVSTEENRRLTENVIDEYAKIAEDKNETAYAKLRCAVLTLLVSIFASHSRINAEEAQSHSAEADRYVRKAIKYIDENSNRRISVEEVAKSLGITKYYLAREFRKHTGETVVAHITGVRLKRAEQLLLQGFTVTEAALESGFESGSYFSQTYKKLKGISPSEIRNTDIKPRCLVMDMCCDSGEFDS